MSAAQSMEAVLVAAVGTIQSELSFSVPQCPVERREGFIFAIRGVAAHYMLVSDLLGEPNTGNSRNKAELGFLFGS